MGPGETIDKVLLNISILKSKYIFRDFINGCNSIKIKNKKFKNLKKLKQLFFWLKYVNTP